ncbi:MAG: hypothetical protein WAW92_04710 [Minisyncoccia bacterium]
MKTFSIYKQMSKEYFDIWTKRFEKVTPDYSEHPREDYHLQSMKYLIFVIADGVTLKRDEEGNYPNPSGSGELAKLFCEAIISEAEKLYETFSGADLKKVFEVGNNVAREFNVQKGFTKENINYRENDFFAVAASFVLIKESKMYWWSICDTGITMLDKDGNQVFLSPERGKEDETYFPVNWSELATTEQNKYIKKTFRNKLDKDGKQIGYGVANGEEGALSYLNSGILSLLGGELTFLSSDGFENYFKLLEFVNLFINWSDDEENKLEYFSNLKIKENPRLYGQERSLIIIKT